MMRRICKLPQHWSTSCASAGRYWSYLKRFSTHNHPMKQTEPVPYAPMAYAGLGQQVAALMQPPQWERIDQMLLQHGIIPRHLTRKYLRKNDVLGVTPNSRDKGLGKEGVLLKSGAEKVDPLTVSVNGQYLEYVEPLHIAMYKPEGVVCSHSDEEGVSVFDLLPSDFGLRRPQLNCVGRLDKDTSGLLLLSQSGMYCIYVHIAISWMHTCVCYLQEN
eukprot:gb/GECG01003476.1/.p1 GENE.gb/GECG01003476.1/~~gb/GECG01003476.1/.p1  ORF type:complete len:217 (+),score=13.41 gb/GECG01003476.1/:1-651(+)